MRLVELAHKAHLKTISRYWLGLLRGYFRIDVQGIENIPRRGRAIIAPNHAGFAGADAVLLTYVIKRETRRRARILAHRAYFDFSIQLKAFSESFGLRRASLWGGIETLEKDHLLVLFPEGEAGNFKPSLKRYRVQPFHTGFIRMALLSRAPIVPCVIIGAEETHLSVGNINFSNLVRNLRIPLPLNLFPLPAKWDIAFLEPIAFSRLGQEAIDALLSDPRRLKAEALKIQRLLQRELSARIRKRKYVYFPETRRLLNRIVGKKQGGKRK